MTTYISFLEKLINNSKYSSIENSWKFMISEKDRPDAAKAIKEYIKQYGRYRYFLSTKHWDMEKKEMVTTPRQDFYYFPFVTKGPLTIPKNCIFLYNFFFKPATTIVQHTWSYE